LPSDAGTGPRSSFCCRRSSRRFESEPSDPGSSPLRPFPKTPRPTTRLPQTVTPNQRLTSTSVAAQPSRQRQPRPPHVSKSSRRTHQAGGLPIHPASCFHERPSSARAAGPEAPPSLRTAASTAAFEADSHILERASGGQAVSKRASSSPFTKESVCSSGPKGTRRKLHTLSQAPFCCASPMASIVASQSR